MATTPFLSRSPGLLNRGSGGLASLEHVPHSSIFSPTGLISICSIGAWGPPLLGAGFLYRIFSNWLNFLCTELYNSSMPPSSCGRHKSLSFNPSTVNIIFWYSSTGCTCYLHRCISYFDSLARVNMQQNGGLCPSSGLQSENPRKLKRMTSCPVGWGCRIHRLHLCWGVHPQISVLDMTLNNLMMKFQWCWGFRGMRSISSLPLLPGPLWPRGPYRTKLHTYAKLNCLKWNCFWHLTV